MERVDSKKIKNSQVSRILLNQGFIKYVYIINENKIPLIALVFQHPLLIIDHQSAGRVQLPANGFHLQRGQYQYRNVNK